ncbi:tyrosine-type recombinase/integrase [Cytobacillus horneckiae]|nr:tyrosine-type recombinase/integrase [Cytobacillus horneckiae]MEC1158926.1 tyrosine-type recombinase/integrase [Cytobacillus horneckiae]
MPWSTTKMQHRKKSAMKNNRQQLNANVENIEKKLTGYWAADVWDPSDYPLPLDKPIKAKYTKCLDFCSINNASIRVELKFFLSERLKHKTYSLGSVFDGYLKALKHLCEFISLKYPHLLSITGVPKERFLIEYRTFLNERNIKTEHLGSALPWQPRYVKQTRDFNFYNQFFDFFNDYYDDREELEKDKWDVRKLGIDYNRSRSENRVSFTNIVPKFRIWFKKYCEIRLVVQRNYSFARVKSIMSPMSAFFQFINDTHPEWSDLRNLNRKDILAFQKYVSQLPSKKTSKNPIEEQKKNRIRVYTYEVQAFLSYIQLLEWDFAPLKPIHHLIFPEDFPKNSYKITTNTIKYIPDEVWEQILDNLPKLNPIYVPILLVLEASGFRISDTLLLKKNCLERSKDGWWLVGDIRKVQYKNHKVPITEDIAAIIKAQIAFVEKYSHDSNPDCYLFPNPVGKRKGLPITQGSFNENINMLAYKCNITDASGETYRIKNHAFRHRYGVTMINNGMNILHLQKLMAHASPEMTLVYAQIKDNTMRSEWEKAVNNGAVRLAPNGSVIDAYLEDQAKENGLELEWIRHNMDSIRLDHGFCIKSPKLPCDFLNQMLEPPCIRNNCRSFHVDKTFLDYYKDQIAKIESDIEIFQSVNRTRSIELIQPKLQRYKEIANSLEVGKGIQGLTKERREYTTNERNEVST